MSEFVHIRSWHIVSTPTRVPDHYLTLCGRVATGKPVSGLPAGKSCESCFRLAEWLREPEDDASTQPVETVP